MSNIIYYNAGCVVTIAMAWKYGTVTTDNAIAYCVGLAIADLAICAGWLLWKYATCKTEQK